MPMRARMMKTNFMCVQSYPPCCKDRDQGQPEDSLLDDETKELSILLLGRGCRVTGHRDVLQPGIVVLHHYIRSDRVSGGQLVEFGYRLHRVRHGHRAHKSGNLLSI